MSLRQTKGDTNKLSKISDSVSQTEEIHRRAVKQTPAQPGFCACHHRLWPASETHVFLPNAIFISPFRWKRDYGPPFLTVKFGSLCIRNKPYQYKWSAKTDCSPSTNAQILRSAHDVFRSVTRFSPPPSSPHTHTQSSFCSMIWRATWTGSTSGVNVWFDDLCFTLIWRSRLTGRENQRSADRRHVVSNRNRGQNRDLNTQR